MVRSLEGHSDYQPPKTNYIYIDTQKYLFPFDWSIVSSIILGANMSTENKLRQVAEVMARMAGDTSVPRNIRRAANDARDHLLKDDDEAIVNAASAISILDDISNDPNMPVHARTIIWNALSILESVSGHRDVSLLASGKSATKE